MQQSSTSASAAPSLLTNAAAIRSLGPVTLVGQSHVGCIAAALAGAPNSLKVIELWKLANPLKMDELPVLQKRRGDFKGVTVSVLGGSRFEALAMYRHPRPFDFISPLEPDSPLEQDAEIIPYEAMRAAVLDKIAHNLSLLDAVKQMSKGVVLHVASPPAWGDARNVADWDPGFIRPVTPEFGSRYLRRKIDRIHTDLVNRYCAERGIEVIEPPAETIDEEGFLKREFSADLLHGTPAYGQLLAEKILRRVAALKAGGA